MRNSPEVFHQVECSLHCIYVSLTSFYAAMLNGWWSVLGKGRGKGWTGIEGQPASLSSTHITKLQQLIIEMVRPTFWYMFHLAKVNILVLLSHLKLFRSFFTFKKPKTMLTHPGSCFVHLQLRPVVNDFFIWPILFSWKTQGHTMCKQ